MTIQIDACRNAVDAYRKAHAKMHSKGWRKGISEDHTPLLEKMVSDLEAAGVVSSETDFEAKKSKVLSDFWKASDEQNAKELGFVDKKDFDEKATKEDKDALRLKWR